MTFKVGDKVRFTLDIVDYRGRFPGVYQIADVQQGTFCPELQYASLVDAEGKPVPEGHFDCRFLEVVE